jgi:hypothetical protein
MLRMVKFALYPAMKAQSERVEVWLYSFFNLDADVNVTPRPLYLREEDPAATVCSRNVYQ